MFSSPASSAPPSHLRIHSSSTSAPNSPTSASRSASVPWRTSAKRAHNQGYPCSPSYGDITSSSPPHKWNVDSWRRGKRPRIEQSPPSSLPGIDRDTQSVTSMYSSPDPPTFPSTSDAFNIFPSTPSRSTHSPASSPLPAKVSSSASDFEAEISALRSTAFWELRKSIIEGGEGFVQRMRAWESTRALTGHPHQSSGNHPRRGRSYSRMSVPRRRGSPDVRVDEEDEDEEAQNFAAGASSETGAWFPMSGIPPKKRTRSVGTMDIQSARPLRGTTLPPLPPLSSTASSSTSSLASTPAPLVFGDPASGEKAVAEISLALANGAAGLTDYSAVHDALGPAAAGVDENGSEVGEMWH